MSADTVYCRVLGDDITLVTDSAGKVTKIVCPSLSSFSHKCEIKGRGKGFLRVDAELAGDRMLGTKMIICDFGDPNKGVENFEKGFNKLTGSE